MNTISETIESVRSQNYPNIEYIVIDGGSNDGTLDILNDYSESIDLIVSEADEGMYDAINKGIQKASGYWIALLHADDVYTSSDVISEAISLLENEKADALYADVRFVKRDQPDRMVRYYSSERFKPWKLRFGWMPAHPTFISKKEVFDSFGLYELGYSISSDYEMMIRLLYVNRIPTVYLPKAIVQMREGGLSSKSLWSRIILNKEIVRACRAHRVYTNMVLLMLKIPFKWLEYSWVARRV